MSNTVKTALLLGVLSALLLFIGEKLGGTQGMAIGFLFAAATNFGSYWFSDKIVLRMYRAQEVGPGHRLYDTVARAGRARRPAPAARLRDSRRVAECFRDRPQPSTRGRGGDGRDPPGSQRRGAR